MDFQQYIEKVKHGAYKSFLKKTLALGLSVELILHEKIPVVKITHGEKTLFCYGKVPLFRSMCNLTKNKSITKFVLESVGIRTPKGIVTHSFEDGIREVREKNLTYPLISKPVDGSLAKGVTWNITSEAGLQEAIEHALGAYGYREDIKILVEEMFVGNEYRVLVFNGKVLSCVEKIPAGITGDGEQSIQDLIHSFNKTRRHGFEIKLDTVAKETLSKAGYTLKTILPKDSFFKLRNNLNMSDGGRCIERTATMDKELQKTCVKAVESLGLTYGGLDLITNNISLPGAPYVILEVNPNPYYNMHEKPLVEGDGIDVSLILLKYLFPSL
jgi:cyanophycin synthetase